MARFTQVLLDLRDWREERKPDSKHDCMSDELSKVQGPAIYQFNDAVFKPDDFESITKPADGTASSRVPSPHICTHASPCD